MSEPAATIVDQQADAVIIRVQAADMDETNARRVQAEVSVAAGNAPQCPVVLDLTQVRFLPSLSLAALIRVHTECRARQQQLMLTGLRPELRNVLLITRLDRLFDLHPDVDAALRRIRRA